MSNRLNEINQNIDRVLSLNEESIHKRNIEKYNKNKRYRELNPEKFKSYKRSKEKDRFYKEVRRAKEKKLEANVSQREWDMYIKNKFNSRCPILNSEDFHIDHFIPLSWGHGGTYIGNVIPLSPKLNISKGNKNPFEWRNLLNDEHKMKFDLVVEHLSEINGMSYDLFKEYVYWCEKNKRDALDIVKEESSLHLFRKYKYNQKDQNNTLCSLNESQKLSEINIYIKLLKRIMVVNKGTPVYKETILECCKSNGVKFFSFYNRDVRSFFEKERINYNPRFLLNK
jgi:hypothetical protein